MLLQLYITANY